MAYSLKLDNDLFIDRYLNERAQMSQTRWPDGPSGHPDCDGKPIFIPETGLYSCTDCGHVYNPLEGIVLRHYRLKFPQLAKAMQTVRRHGNETSPTILASDLGVTYATTRKLIMRILSLPEFGGATPTVRPYRKRSEGDYERGKNDALLDFAQTLEKIDLNQPSLTEEQRATIKRAFVWAAKIARQKAFNPER